MKFDINFFSALLLIVLFITMKLRNEAVSTSSGLFFRLLWSVVLLLMLEVLSWAFDRREGYYHLNYFFNFAMAFSTSITPCLWASYIDYHMFESYERLRKRWFYSHTLLINGLLLLINIFRPFIFSVSPENVYSREPGMMVMAFINLGLFAYISLLAYRERQRIEKAVVWVLLLYILMPVVVAFMQVAFFGIFILWPMMAITVVLTYIFLETVSTSRDYLTGLLTRSRIDAHLEYLLGHDRKFTLVMIDLDKFKEINDTYGHLEGDKSLKLFSGVLLRVFSPERLVGRYAGDEFILILEKMTVSEIRKKMARVGDEMNWLHKSGHLEFQVKFSYGYYEIKGSEQFSYRDVVGFADNSMYLQKKSKENENERELFCAEDRLNIEKQNTR